MADYFDNFKNGAKKTYENVRDETKEVVQEVKAAVKGEKLDSAGTVGGAGYRTDSSAGNGLAVASLVLGILSLIFAFFGHGAIIGLVLGIIGTVLGANARKKAQTGLATAGFICSLIGLILCAAGLMCVLWCFNIFDSISEML